MNIWPFKTRRAESPPARDEDGRFVSLSKRKYRDVALRSAIESGRADLVKYWEALR